jgi:hypothetical protein
MQQRFTAAMVLVVALGPSAAAQQKAAVPPSSAHKIASALSAAPRAVAAGASVVEMGADGKMKTLRNGTNGWLCMPANAEAPGPDPMCIDKPWQAWLSAYMAKKPPTTTQIGIAYMLAGGADASNTDPYAQKPAPGEKWVMSPAHMMVLLPDAKELDSYPSDPSTGGPYIMWKGTPYAHLMVPVPKAH